MKPSQLKYFITLAEEQHYTNAASLLGIAQSSLSKSISNLEDEIGVTLFEKVGRNITLTDCGKVFLESAKEATSIIDEGVRKMKMIQADIKGELSIGHMYLQGYQYFTKYINGYKKMHKDVLPVFHFDYNVSPRIVEGIKDDTYDVGFAYKQDVASGVEFVPVMVDRMVLVVPEGHPLAEYEEVNISDIVEYPFLFYNRKSTLHNMVEEYFRGVKKYPNVAGTVKEVSTLLEMVKCGMGIGITPRSTIEGCENVVSVELSKVCTRRVIYFIYANDKYLAPAVKRFVNYMVENHKVTIE